MIELTAKQRKALRDAYAVPVKGLHRFNAIPDFTSNGDTWHHCETVSELIKLGLLCYASKQKTLVLITPQGMQLHEQLSMEHGQLQHQLCAIRGRNGYVVVDELNAISKPDEPPAPKRQINADGSVEFTCVECDAAVFCAVDDGFDFPVCMECRWFGEHPQVKREADR